jgi:hypothetical protein
MAAGLGFKTFTTGEVLTAADVNGYLMQGVLVFASEAARNAAITSPQEGQFAFTKDNNSLWYYSGSAWVASGATGDIEGVTAGTGISGGGTSGTVTITNSMATAIDAKGDLIPGTGADTFSRLAVGANGTVLTADSAEATGLKWAAPAAGGFVGASIYNNASQAISNTTWTTLNFNSEVFDTDTFHDTASNNSRITIPSGKNGKYLIVAKWHFQGNASGSDRLGAFKKNGTAIGSYRGINGNSSSVGWGASVILDLVATDYIELEVYQDSGGNLNAFGGPAPEYNFLQVQFLGA